MLKLCDHDGMIYIYIYIQYVYIYMYIYLHIEHYGLYNGTYITKKKKCFFNGI